MSSEDGGHQKQRLYRKNSRVRKAPGDLSGPEKPDRKRSDGARKISMILGVLYDVISQAANHIQETGPRDVVGL